MIFLKKCQIYSKIKGVTVSRMEGGDGKVGAGFTLSMEGSQGVKRAINLV